MKSYDRLLKILLLIIFSCLFFLPSLLADPVEDNIKQQLEENGFTVLSLAEIPILTPDKNISCVINNLNKLKQGKNILDITVLYEEKFYANFKLEAELYSSESLKKDQSLLNKKNTEYLNNRDFLLKPGETVEIIWSSKNLIIRSPGKILKSCSSGEETEVLNLSFNTIVRGTVLDKRKIILK